jgi:uncharacterized membrane protein YdjX (TVP38/TMEM64 family)
MRILFVLGGFLFFGLTLFFLLGDAWVDKGRLEALGPWAWLAAVGLLVADVFLPIPTTVVITVMGQKYGPLLGGAIGTLGSVSAGLVAYGSTRILGPRFARLLLGNDLEKAERFYRDSGAFAVACSRWLPLLPEAISCMAGLARMPFRKYCLALVCGSAPMCWSYAALANISDNELLPLIVSLVLPVPIWWVAGRLLYARSAATEPMPNDQTPKE